MKNIIEACLIYSINKHHFSTAALFNALSNALADSVEDYESLEDAFFRLNWHDYPEAEIGYDICIMYMEHEKHLVKSAYDIMKRLGIKVNKPNKKNYPKESV